jgi:hypothetical protein
LDRISIQQKRASSTQLILIQAWKTAIPIAFTLDLQVADCQPANRQMQSIGTVVIE